MALKLSTGLRNALLATAGIKSSLDGGLIKIYAGTVPTAADDVVPAGATLLCTISINSAGTGINFDTAASAGTIVKAPADTWSGVNAATGTAAWYRHVAPADDGTASTTQKRIQGLVGTSGTDMNLSSVSFTSGATTSIQSYSVTLPTP